MVKRKILSAAMVMAMVFGEAAGTYVYAAEGGTKEETQNTQEESVGLSNEALAAYYGESVFVGDSIMLGFRNYCMKRGEDSFVRSIQFLAAGSYSANNALKPVTPDSVHPLYRGKKYQVWDAVSLMKSKRVFILLGMNDISILGVEGARDKYKELIDRILEKCPDVEIHILSMTHTVKDEGKKTLNNENIEQFNLLMQELVRENGWGYMDVSTPLTDEEGNLIPGYCSDGFVHLSRNAYDVWVTILSNYALVQPEAIIKQQELDAKAAADAEAKAESKAEPQAGAKAKTKGKAEAETKRN